MLRTPRGLCVSGQVPLKPLWIERFLAGTFETLVNKGFQDRSAGDALNTRGSGHPYLRRPKHSGSTLPKKSEPTQYFGKGRRYSEMTVDQGSASKGTLASACVATQGAGIMPAFR